MTVPGAQPCSHWWVARDVHRLIARADHTNGGPIDTDELRYMRAYAELLLAEVLPLADGDRARVANLHGWLLVALAERAGARIEDGRP